MQPGFQRRIVFSLALALASGAALTAQAVAPAAADAIAAQAAAAPAATVTIRGRITDPDGALIPGAKVTIATPEGKTVTTATANASGDYEVRGLKPGTYVVRAEFTGFAPFQSQGIAIAAGQGKRVDIKMAIQVAQQNVVVTDDVPTVNVEASGNSNAIVIKGKDLDALSDDPDELSNELSALAGPSAGPNGGQIYIDGFSGGQLPPKSAIREIRINQNPFSAEFDRLGYGRIEILTKPGTDKLHGQFFAQGNDGSFNTNPLTQNVPDYYSYHFNGTLSGSINKSTSFFVSAERRNIGSANNWIIDDLVLPDADGTYSVIPSYSVAVPSQRVRTNVSGRIDWQVGEKNTLTARYGFRSENDTGTLSQSELPSASTHSDGTDHTLQLSDSYVINDHVVNETRFQYERDYGTDYPDSTDRTFSVVGYFTGGGASTQTNADHSTRLELQNLTTWSAGAHAIKFGMRLRDSRDANFTNEGYNGSFSFSDATVNGTKTPAYIVYQNFVNGLQSGKTFAQLVAEGWGPSSASYTYGNESAVANMFDAALFFQDDWKVNRFLTLSGGLRWESQNHVPDHNDWAPRFALAYALDGHKGGQPKTVLRAGWGLFYDRFASGNGNEPSQLLYLQRFGIGGAGSQTKVVLNFPDCSDSTATSLNAVDMTTCQNGESPSGAVSASSSVPVHYQLQKGYRSPMTDQAGIGIERQVTRTISATLTYLHSFGTHQLVTLNANQYNYATGEYPLDPAGSYRYQYTSEGLFKQNQLIMSVNARVSRNLSLVGFYTLGYADGNTGTASNAYNLAQDYGPSPFNKRSRMFAMANYNGPWGLRFNPFLVADAGTPFNITLQNDTLNGLGNQRPGAATADECSSDTTGRYISTVYGCMDSKPVAGEQLIPSYLGTGPAGVAFNLRVSRSFGFGPETGGQNGGGPMGGGPPGGGGHHGGGGPGGGLGPGGLSGGGGGPRGSMFGNSVRRRYALTFSAQALNLFNNVDLGTPNGTLGSKTFNQSTYLAGGIFSSGSASRRIFLQAIFSF